MVTDLSHFVCVAMNAPLYVPFIVIMVRQWRFPKQFLLRFSSTCMVLYLVACGFIYRHLGNQPLCLIFMGFLPTITNIPIYAWLTTYRGGRYLFTTVTAGLLTSVCDVFAGSFVPYASWDYVIIKALGVVCIGTALWYARDSIQWLLESTSHGWTRISLIPLALWIAILFTYVLPISVKLGVPNHTAAVCLCAAVPICYVAFSYFVRAIQTELQSARDGDILRSQVRVMESQIKLIRVEQDKNRIFRHDLRHYLRLLEGSLKEGNVAQASGVLSTMQTAMEISPDGQAELQSYTGDMLLDTVFSVWEEHSTAAGVDFSVQLTLPPALEIDMTELAVVVSDALDNALRACKAMPEGEERWIRVYGSPGAQQLFLAIDNTYEGEVTFNGKEGLPVSDRPGHGYGTRSIAAFAKKYGGTYSFSAKEGVFSLRILI